MNMHPLSGAWLAGLCVVRVDHMQYSYHSESSVNFRLVLGKEASYLRKALSAREA